MNKNEIIQNIISDMQAKKTQQKSERDAAYFRALNNAEFARLDREVRVLTAKGINSDALKKATAARDKLFANYYTAPKSGNVCTCVQKCYTQKLIEQSGFTTNAPKIFDDKLTSKFTDQNIKTEYRKIYNALSQFCEKFPNVKKQNIILSGATGTGKTYAAQIIANNLMERGFSVLYLTAFSLIQRFKNYIFNQNSVDNDALFEVDLLIIDDLGTEPVIRNISQEYLYNVINERLVAKKSFIITTNLNPEALAERYDQRIASRVLSRETSAVIEFRSDDLRLV